MSRICQTTQNIPAPQGPRPRPPCARNRTAPLLDSHKTRKDIPADKILDVLRNPAHYCEVYPETFPLTRKLVRHLQTQAVALARSHANQADNEGLARGPLGEPEEVPGNVCFHERLPTAGDEIVVPNGAAVNDEASYRRRKLPPIGMELQATRKLVAHGCARPHLMHNPVGGVTSEGQSSVRGASEERLMLYGPRNRTVMDMVERGEWLQPQLVGTMGYEVAVGEAMVLSSDGTWSFQSSYTICSAQNMQEWGR
ncbi:hypothetical protein BV20DRAFT_544407 [Pilatotrama ljubarskyi]|nr:hypothetical protein BV20DRAFT_544407 [Pilatotrama ljubarskyi]